MSISHQKTSSEVINNTLERGLKLRNSLVQSILSYGPSECLNNKLESTNSNSQLKSDDNKLKAYLQGDFMSKDDENSALETLRSLSNTDLCSITDRSYTGPRQNSANKDICNCATCKEYNSLDFSNHEERLDNKIGQENSNFFKYVDSLKVVINSLHLTEAGCKKITDFSPTTFFIEYQLPDFIRKLKTKPFNNDQSKVVRFCARQSHNCDVINFKHNSLHDINNLNQVDLNKVTLKFRVSCRGFRQKQASLFGCAHLNFDAFQTSPNLNFKQLIPVALNESVPITVGFLSVSLSLGCGRIYFGKQFIGAISASKENSTISLLVDCKESQQYNKPSKVAKIEIAQEPSRKSILFGLVCVTEARFNREVVNSYVSCQNFTKDDVSTSKLVALIGPNPIYNFSQQIPLIYDDFIINSRENHLLVEFWEKGDYSKDFTLGLIKLPLHSFYLAYRNPLISKYLAEKELPVVSIDGWEAIQTSINDDKIIGHALTLLALGTQEQIDSLERQRGFKNQLVKAKLAIKSKKQQSNAIRRDIGVQSEIKMSDSEQPSHIENLLDRLATTTANKPPDDKASPDNLKHVPEILQSLQETLTMINATSHGIERKDEIRNSFRAQIAVNEAMNLPNRKKCKSRRSKNHKGGKNEDTLPSTYVTFEPSQGEIRITHVIPKSVTPKWKFLCEVLIPHEYLLNDEKRLVFKVWRKSVNATMTPNLQTDVVIGIAALDLAVLTKGLPQINGWFDITDFCNKCNGQINIRVTPLENVTKIRREEPESAVASNRNDDLVDLLDGPSELGRALKRKFSELDEITQRLRLRLSKVTNDDDDGGVDDDDNAAEEFERDINTLCIEDDYDTVDFEKEALNFKLNRMKQIGLLHQGNDSQAGEQMVNNKQQIDNLLEKLSLISGGTSSVRQSDSSDVDTEAILDDLDHHSRPNLYSASSFDKCMGEKFPGWKNQQDCNKKED